MVVCTISSCTDSHSAHLTGSVAASCVTRLSAQAWAPYAHAPHVRSLIQGLAHRATLDDDGVDRRRPGGPSRGPSSTSGVGRRPLAQSADQGAGDAITGSRPGQPNGQGASATIT